MKNYTEMTDDELYAALAHLQSSAATQIRNNEPVSLPTEEELQARLDQLQANQPSNFLLFSTVIALWRLWQELQVHQVELEIKTRELRRARQEIAEARNRYVGLYDFATGYMTFESLSHGVLGALSAQIAILDKAGRIIEVNGAWTRFTLENGGEDYLLQTGVGNNYLTVCQRVVGEDAELAMQALRGIQSVLDGSQAHFTLEYPCHSPTQQRWFILSVSPLLRDSGGVVVTHVDISERKRAELAVAESEARLAGVLNSAMDAIITTDAAHRIILFNEAAEEMFGCSAQEAIGQPLEKFTPERYRKKYATYLKAHGDTKVTRRRTGQRSVIFGLRADGEEFPMESAISQVEVNGQQFFTVIYRDITGRKQAEEKLRASEEKFRRYIDHNPAAVAMFDREMHYLAVSPRWLQDYQLTAEIIGRSHYEIFPEISERWKAIYHRCLGGAVEKAAEDCFERANGSVYWLKWEARPWFDTTGAIGGIIIYSEDITERRLAQARLVEQAAMLNQAQEAIMVRELNGNIRFWNQGAERLYGWSAEEIIGRPIIDLLYRGDLAQFQEAMKTVVERGDWVGELRQFAKDGRALIINARWSLIRDEQGQPKSILTINNDITEKKQLEAQFLRAQRLESIGTLASGIAHDFNNVLSPILMAVQLLQMRLKDESSQRLLEMLQLNIQRGSEMVKQVLSFARGTTGERLGLQPQHLLKEVVSMLNETFPKNIFVKYVVLADLHLINGDPTQIYQVLMNLCVNARDAMQVGGGTLTIGAENKFVDEQFASMIPNAKTGEYVVITINDTGTGIEPEVLDRIFDPFFTTKEVGKGTGLGLSIAYSIIKSHGGFVTVSSEVGKGTTFHLYLPEFTTTQPLQSLVQMAELPLGGGELILVVDDERAIREITQGTLESFGYRVLTAVDGTDALVLYAQHKDDIRLVLTDMMMPYLDGPALIRSLHKINPAVTVIASSGLRETEEERAAEELGVKHFLTKPYTAQELLQTIAKVLDKGSVPLKG